MPPAGTATWRGYPFSGTINGHWLASSYKGYVESDGETHFKQEISHTTGYTGSRDKRNPSPPASQQTAGSASKPSSATPATTPRSKWKPG
jgi:hypothetical protein